MRTSKRPRVYKVDNSPAYHYEFYALGRRFRGSTGEPSERAAQKFAAQKFDEVIELARSGQLDPGKPTLDFVAGRFWREHAHALRSAASVKGYLTDILASVGPNKLYREVGIADVSQFIQDRRAAGRRVAIRGTNDTRRSGEVTDSTINRAIAVWKSMHNKAALEWEYEVRPISWTRVWAAEPRERVRSATADEAQSLLDILPDHIRHIACFALYTGLRERAVFELEWDRVDMTRAVARVPRMKNKARSVEWVDVELNDMAMLVLQERLVGRRQGDTRVFDPTNFRRHWEAARAKVDIADFRFHDLRHTFATWLGERGVRIEVVSKLLGHSNIQVTMKYLHVFEHNRRAAVAALPALRLGNVQPLRIPVQDENIHDAKTEECGRPQLASLPKKSQ